MSELTASEARILGVLIEKARTVPASYPLTLNALQSGANQKSNRHPVMKLTEDQILHCIDGLKAKGYVLEVLMSGSRVLKYRHITKDKLKIETPQLAILAELLLRGPQTTGEIRTRASRMYPIESLEVCMDIIGTLMDHESKLVVMYPPSPGSRAETYGCTLGPHADPSTPVATSYAESPVDPGASIAAPPLVPPADAAETEALKEEINTLKEEVSTLKRALTELAGKLGEEINL